MGQINESVCISLCGCGINVWVFPAIDLSLLDNEEEEDDEEEEEEEKIEASKAITTSLKVCMHRLIPLASFVPMLRCCFSPSVLPLPRLKSLPR